MRFPERHEYRLKCHANLRENTRVQVYVRTCYSTRSLDRHRGAKMRCAICGFSNIHGAKFCSECGSPLQMQDAGKSARRNSDRKVIKLPSDMANEPTTPIERPWEVRVPKREATSPTSGATTGTPINATSSARRARAPRRVAGPARPAGFPPSSARQTRTERFRSRSAPRLPRAGRA